MNYSRIIFLFFIIISSCKNEKEQYDSGFTYLALGDSYTIGEGIDIKGSFPFLIAQEISLIDSVKIIAKRGWTTDELIDTLNNLNIGKYDIVSLLIGVNNQYDGYNFDNYVMEFDHLLRKAISYSNNKQNVFVLSIPDYGVTPIGKSIGSDIISREINSYNDLNRLMSEKHNIMYFDITDISRGALNDSTLLANDQLHPSQKMYEMWVEKVKYQLLDSLSKN
mgnify:FL=1